MRHSLWCISTSRDVFERQNSLWCISTSRVYSSVKNFIMYRCSSLNGATFVISVVSPLLHAICILTWPPILLPRCYLPQRVSYRCCQDTRKKICDGTSWLPFIKLCLLLSFDNANTGCVIQNATQKWKMQITLKKRLQIRVIRQKYCVWFCLKHVFYFYQFFRR